MRREVVGLGQASELVAAGVALLNQPAAIRSKKLNSDFSFASSRGLPQDQDYLAYAQAHGSNVTRQEYDALRSQLENGSNGTVKPGVTQAMQLQSGLFAVSGGSPNAPWMRPALAPQPTVAPPAGSSAQAPAPMGPAWPQPGQLPNWALPAGIAAAVLLGAMMLGRRR